MIEDECALGLCDVCDHLGSFDCLFTCDVDCSLRDSYLGCLDHLDESEFEEI